MSELRQINIKVRPALHEALDSYCRSQGLQKGHFIERLVERALASATPLSIPAGEELLASAVADGKGQN